MTKTHEADDKPEAAIDRLFEILETIPAEESTIAASVLLGRFLADFGVEPYDDARWDAFSLLLKSGYIGTAISTRERDHDETEEGGSRSARTAKAEAAEEGGSQVNEGGRDREARTDKGRQVDENHEACQEASGPHVHPEAR